MLEPSKDPGVRWQESPIPESYNLVDGFSDSTTRFVRMSRGRRKETRLRPNDYRWKSNAAGLPDASRIRMKRATSRPDFIPNRFPRSCSHRFGRGSDRSKVAWRTELGSFVDWARKAGGETRSILDGSLLSDLPRPNDRGSGDSCPGLTIRMSEPCRQARFFWPYQRVIVAVDDEDVSQPGSRTSWPRIRIGTIGRASWRSIL